MTSVLSMPFRTNFNIGCVKSGWIGLIDSNKLFVQTLLVSGRDDQWRFMASKFSQCTTSTASSATVVCGAGVVNGNVFLQSSCTEWLLVPEQTQRSSCGNDVSHRLVLPPPAKVQCFARGDSSPSATPK